MPPGCCQTVAAAVAAAAAAAVAVHRRRSVARTPARSLLAAHVKLSSRGDVDGPYVGAAS